MSKLGITLPTTDARLTLVETAKVMRLSRARVFQLEHKALEKLRRAIEREASAAGVTPWEWLDGDGR